METQQSITKLRSLRQKFYLELLSIEPDSPPYAAKARKLHELDDQIRQLENQIKEHNP